MWAQRPDVRVQPGGAGGVEPSFAEMIETWIEMAWQDGSFGWIGIANLPSSFAAAAYLPDEGFAEVFTANDNHVTMGGQFAPNGQGVVVDGGYRLTGAWSFGSGTGHSEYIAAGFIPMDDGEMRWISEGIPDTAWSRCCRATRSPSPTAGMCRGSRAPAPTTTTSPTCSCPHTGRSALFTREPLRGSSPAGRMGMMPVTAAGHAAWALGVAKSMLDDVEELAATKYRMSDMASLASRPTFQKGLAHHVAAWRAARLLVLDAFTTAESAVAAGDDLTPTLRADMRVAAVYATDVARECAEWAHLVAGTTLDPRRQPARARVPRHLHRHPARLHQREGGDRRRTGLARHHRRPVRPVNTVHLAFRTPTSESAAVCLPVSRKTFFGVGIDDFAPPWRDA